MNPMHFHSLGELASKEPSESGRIVRPLHFWNLFLYGGDVLPRSCNMIGGTNKTWLMNHASAEGAPDRIGGGGSQAGSKESDGGTE